ncbi:uncharacterized protein LOC116289530 [Actinia tenebrosa]|uniref:Uncharacterized protein LOC116289530 n=1 Tax=Actinia tenebrosa TaxID=6105 RepID=A0A6P8H9W4_ACTTE|nr:uncharacterized protein LOC116289530 [Actinia tenebrosa]
MSSVKIPKWIGPTLCPVVFILLIAAVCFYYCYWKPRREKNKEKKEAENKQVKEKMISPSLSRQSPGSGGKNTPHVHEEMTYECGYYDCEPYTTYEPYCMDYCPLPRSGLSYCVQYDRPKFVYCPTSYHAKSRDTAVQSKCKGTDKIRKCSRVRCPREECIKCPNLPMITEGNSTLSLCDEKEEEEHKEPFTTNVVGTGLIIKDSENEQMVVEGRENLDVKTASVSGQEENTSNCCRDSGFEDHLLP